MDRVRIAIVGAGIAGAATAYFLARQGVRGVVLFEREKAPGTHSTGRNAAILRTAMEDPLLHRLARDSASFYARPPAGFTERPLVDPVGLYLAATEEAAAALRAWAARPACAHGLTETDPEAVYRRVPLLARRLAAAYHQGDEGVLDVHAVLDGFLHGARAAGAELRQGCGVVSLTRKGTRITGLLTDSGPVEAGVVVLATGAWAGRLGAAAGCGLPLKPCRRHILVTQPLPQVDPRWPVVWIGGDEFYLRPESGGLLVSPCDTVPVRPEDAEVTDPAMLERAAEKTSRWLPALAGAGAAHFWAGARSFVPDHRFVVGADPRAEGLVWAAALGGHGITCGPEVGRLAAEWASGRVPEHPAAQGLAPGRLEGVSGRSGTPGI